MVSFGINHMIVACPTCVCCLLSTWAELLYQVCQWCVLYHFKVMVQELDRLLKQTRTARWQMEESGKNENVSGFFSVLILLSRDIHIFLNANTEMSCSMVSQLWVSQGLQEQILLFGEIFHWASKSKGARWRLSLVLLDKRCGGYWTIAVCASFTCTRLPCINA